MVGRPSAAARAGLDAKLTAEKGGKYRVALVDDQGTEVFNKVYASEGAARQGARTWVLNHYEVETQEVPKKKKATHSRNLGPTPSNLIGVMMARADDNEVRAVSLRAQADELEAEAKRLRVAAETLEGPYGQTESS